MKNFLALLICCTILLSTNVMLSQNVNYDNYKSIVSPPPFFNPEPNGTKSFLVTTDGYDNYFLGVDFGEPYIVTNPRDPLNSVCAYNMNSFYYTTDGFNWVRNSPLFPGFSTLGDPVMCFDSVGYCYYMQLYQNGNTYGLVIEKSTNKGISWIGPYGVSATNSGLSDKEWITADQTGGPYSNYLYAGWRQFGSSGMRFVRSTNGGVNWSTPLTFQGSQGAYVSVGPNGSVQGGSVYFACLFGGAETVYRSTDGGQTFSAAVTATFVLGPGVICAGRNTVKNCIRTDAFPRMAADNSFTSTRGYVYIAYADNPTGPDNADIFLVRSTNYGQTWSAPVRVNDDNTTTDQWMPSISVDKSGKIFLCWYDSRVDPGNNLLTNLYGTTSTDGGLTFTPNYPISNVPFNPNNMAVGQPGGENYIGDYIGISAIGNTSYSAWMDGRNNNLGSYVGFYPDFAMITDIGSRNMVNNDSAVITVKIPSVKGPFNDRVKFTATLDTLPASGSVNISFANGKDSMTTYPDSIKLRVSTIGNVTPRLYRLAITGRGRTGVPAHSRTVNLLINVSQLTVGTNRNNIVNFKVNGIQYNTVQQFIFTNSSIVNVQAVSPHTLPTYQYVFTNWSDNGDTTHNVTVNGNLTLTAYYKVQYKLLLSSLVGNSFGGNVFYDSAQTFTFGVLSRNVIYNGQPYTFKGWNGTGTGSYTSPDSSGIDSAVTMSMLNPVLETARWFNLIGIQNLSSEVPKEYKLYQNYPNPFNPSTSINFDIIKTGNVRIILYDVLGRTVKVILNEDVQPGKYKVNFSAEDLASGIYFYKVISNDFVDVKKMLLVK
jgi:hypothetical protein